MDGLLNKFSGNSDVDQSATAAPTQHSTQKQEGGSFMGKLGGMVGGKEQQPETTAQKEEGGFMSKINSMAGGGKSSEQKEDPLDKGVDWVQEHVLGQGKQDNESAVEQYKDEQISDFIRKQYKSSTGKDVPVADKS